MLRFPVAASRSTPAENSGAENAQIGEFIEMRESNIHRLAPTHRKAGNRAVLAVGDHTVMLLDIRHDVGDKVFSEFIARRRPACCCRPASRPATPAAAKAGLSE